MPSGVRSVCTFGAADRSTPEGGRVKLSLLASFDSVADEYDSARPAYPDGVYEALGDVDGLCVLNVGAGTGIASRQLLERGAQVVAVDPGGSRRD